MKVGLGTVIAERRLRITGRPEADVRARLGQPLPLPDDPQDDYYCPYQITGLGDGKVRYAVGVDGLQALELAIRILPTELDAVRRQYPGLGWEDAPPGNDGFSGAVSEFRKEAAATPSKRNWKLILYIVTDSLMLLFVLSLLLNRWAPHLRFFGIAPLGYGIVLGFFVIPPAFFFIFRERGPKDRGTRYKHFYAVSSFFMALWWFGCSAFMVCVTAVMLFGL